MRGYSLSASRWMLCLCLAVTSQSRAQDELAEPKKVVQIELWMAEIDMAKLRTLDLSHEYLDADGQMRKVKIADIVEGKERDVPICQSPDKLLTLLRNAGVARVLAEPKLATTSGRKCRLEIGGKARNATSLFVGTMIEATPKVKTDGQIELDLKAEYTEPMPAVRWRGDPGTRQVGVQTAFVIEPGKAALVTPLAQMTYVNGPPESGPYPPTVFVRATIANPSDTQANQTAAAANRTLR